MVDGSAPGRGVSLHLRGTDELEWATQSTLHGPWSLADYVWDGKAFSATPAPHHEVNNATERQKAREPGSRGAGGPARCRVSGCLADLSAEKFYYKVSCSSGCDVHAALQ